MTTSTQSREALAEYARTELRGAAVYRGYRPRQALLQRIAALRPVAHIVVVSAPWCPDCRRDVPKLARIVESLPGGWTVELRGDDAETRDVLEVRAIPTFIVTDQETGVELGRIVESAAGPDGLEGDLLGIVAGAVGGERTA